MGGTTTDAKPLPQATIKHLHHEIRRRDVYLDGARRQMKIGRGALDRALVGDPVTPRVRKLIEAWLRVPSE